MTINANQVFPVKVRGMLCPGRVYDGGRREIGLTYEELNQIVRSIKSERPLGVGILRTIVNEIYGFSDGKHSLDEIAKRLGFEFGYEVEGEALIPLIEALRKSGVLKLKERKR